MTERVHPGWKPAEILLALLFLLAPLYYHPNIGGEGLRIPHNSTLWLLALVFIAYSLHRVIRAPQFVVPRYFIFIAAFPILVTLSGFVTGVEQPLKWAFRLLFIVGGLAFFFSLFQHRLTQGRMDRLLYLVALSGLVHAGIGLLQIWLKADLPYLLPKSPTGVPSGLFQHSNNQPIYLVTVIAIGLYLSARPLLRHRGWLRVAPLWLSLALSAYIVGVIGSRMGPLALLIVVPLLLVTLYKPMWRNRRVSGALLLAVVLGFGAAMVPSGQKLATHSAELVEGYSGNARLGIYDITLGLAKQQPLFGHGIGSFAREFQFARPAFYQARPEARLPKEMVSHPHNELLFWLVEGGLTAVAGILLVLVGTLLALWQCGRRGMAYGALLLPMALHTQLELPFYISGLHWFVFLLLLALPFRHALRVRHNGMTVYASKLSSAAVWLFGALFIVFLAHTVRANWDIVDFYEGINRDNPMPIAKANPYLSDQAYWIDMNIILHSSMQAGFRDNVSAYVQWGEQRLMDWPNIGLYQNMLAAYEFMGDKAAYCATARQGLAIYPQDEKLAGAVRFCED